MNKIKKTTKITSNFRLPQEADVILLAQNYNPSIVSKEWLYTKNILTESPLNFIHTPVFSAVETSNFNLIIDQARLQLSAKNIQYSTIEELRDIIVKFIVSLPETPYKAIGLNYRYLVPTHTYQIAQLLSPNDANLKKLLSPVYYVGAVVSFTFNKFIVNLSIGPPTESEAEIKMNFNFHSDIQSVKDIKNRVNLQPQLLKKATQIVKGVSSG